MGHSAFVSLCKAIVVVKHGCHGFETVRATSVVLLLGVGSFVCYKLYRRLRRHLKRKRDASGLGGHGAKLRGRIAAAGGKFSADPPPDLRRITECYFGPSFDSDDASELSDSCPVNGRNASSGLADTSSSCGSWSDAEDGWSMGVGSSNPYEPVHFDSRSGDVRFRGSRSNVPPSSPLDVRARGGVGSLPSRATWHQSRRHGLLPEKRPKSLGDENFSPVPRAGRLGTTDREGSLDSPSFEADAAGAWDRDTDSLQANFSVGSLTERSRRTEELLAGRSVSFASEDDDDALFVRGPPSDSAPLRSRSVDSSRRTSVESEPSDASVFGAVRVEVPCEAVVAMDRLETILLDTKRELLDLDAELVSLKALRKPPGEREPRLAPSVEDDDDSGKSVGRKDSLLDVVGRHKSSARSRGLLEEPAAERRDSGSDFGNSLESDNEPRDSPCASLEWDPACLPGERGSDSTDGSSDAGNPLRRRSGARAAGTLREQIRKAIRSDSHDGGKMVRSRTVPAGWLSRRGNLPESKIREDSATSSVDARSRTVSEEPSPTVDDGASDFASDPNGNVVPDRCTRDSGYGSAYGDLNTPVGDRVTLADYVRELCEGSVRTNYDEKYLVSLLLDLGVGTARRMRDDGCSAVRAAAFGVLANGGSALAHHGGAREVYKKLYDVFSSNKGSWLETWQFCPGLGYNGNVSRSEGFWDCLSCLQDIEDQLRETESKDRESVLAAALNRDPTLDARIVEAVKLVALKSALDLYEDRTNRAASPTFAAVLFSRDTSRNPEEFLANHLDGEEGIQEVELYLLGYALETTLTVLRLGRADRDDLVRRYPECRAGTWPRVLLSELDGRYWVFGR